MIDMVQKYMRGDATGMETYIDLGADATAREFLPGAN
jgi:hypothetical protein